MPCREVWAVCAHGAALVFADSPAVLLAMSAAPAHALEAREQRLRTRLNRHWQLHFAGC